MNDSDRILQALEVYHAAEAAYTQAEEQARTAHRDLLGARRKLASALSLGQRRKKRRAKTMR